MTIPVTLLDVAPDGGQVRVSVLPGDHGTPPPEPTSTRSSASMGPQRVLPTACAAQAARSVEYATNADVPWLSASPREFGACLEREITVVIDPARMVRPADVGTVMVRTPSGETAGVAFDVYPEQPRSVDKALIAALLAMIVLIILLFAM